jgi:hypothetical protein
VIGKHPSHEPKAGPSAPYLPGVVDAGIGNFPAQQLPQDDAKRKNVLQARIESWLGC